MSVQQTLRLEEPLNVFRTWYLIVYHPREIFSFVFKTSGVIKLQTTILLGLLQYKVDIARHNILGPFKFSIESSILSILMLSFSQFLIRKVADQDHLISTLCGVPFSMSISIPNLTDFGPANSIILSTVLVISLLMLYFPLSICLWLLSNKSIKFKDIFIFTTYSVQSMMFSMFFVISLICSVILTVMIFLDVNESFFISCFLFMFFIMPVSYMLIGQMFRIFFINTIIVLRQILKQEIWRIILLFLIPLLIQCVFFASF